MLPPTYLAPSHFSFARFFPEENMVILYPLDDEFFSDSTTLLSAKDVVGTECRQVTKNNRGIRLFEASQIPEVRGLSIFVADISLIILCATQFCHSQNIYRQYEV